MILLHDIVGRNIDALAREHLWHRGLGYRHGTGHGIGSFLSIHEGPGRINTGRTGKSEATLQEGMVFSDGKKPLIIKGYSLRVFLIFYQFPYTSN